MRACLQCGSDLDFLKKNRKALYCNLTCKNLYRKIRCPEEISLRQKEYFDSHFGRAIRLYHAAKRREPENNELSVEWIAAKLRTGFCEVTKLPFVYSEHGRNPWAPSIDKINPDEGYTLENSRVVVWMYNAAKNVYSDEEVLILAKALTDGSMKSQTSKRERRK